MVDAYLTHGSKLVDITNEFLKACEGFFLSIKTSIFIF